MTMDIVNLLVMASIVVVALLGIGFVFSRGSG